MQYIVWSLLWFTLQLLLTPKTTRGMLAKQTMFKSVLLLVLSRNQQGLIYIPEPHRLAFLLKTRSVLLRIAVLILLIMNEIVSKRPQSRLKTSNSLNSTKSMQLQQPKSFYPPLGFSMKINRTGMRLLHGKTTKN